MKIEISASGPASEAVHVDLAADAPASRAGVQLTLTDPDQILRAARSAGQHDADWVIWRAASLPCSEKRAAAFVVSLARRVRGRVIVVLDESRGRDARIAGHIRRAGLSVED